MKRALAFTLMVLAIMIIAVSCEEPQAPHEHTYAPEWTYDDTFHWHASACGHEEEVSDKEAHKWKGGDEDGWIVDVDSTEKEVGKKHRECSVCGYKEEGTVPLQGHVHTFSAYDHNSDKHWRTCTGCGETFTYSHTFSCASVNETYHCQKCQCGYSENTEAHSYNNGKQMVSGETVYNICDLCGYLNEVEKAKSNSEIATAGATETVTPANYTTKPVEIVNKDGEKETKTLTVNNTNVEITVTSSAVSSTIDTSTATAQEIERTKTTVSFLPGALKVEEGAKTVSLIVESAPAAVASSAEYQTTTSDTTVITSGETALAGLEFRLVGADASDLTADGSTEDRPMGTVVTTYITPNLDGGKLAVKYIGEGTQPDNVSYNASNGQLKFTVYHFSKYVIVSTDDALVVTDNLGAMYSSFRDALNKLSNSSDNKISKITLLRDANLAESVTVEKSATLDLNGKKVDITNTCKISAATGVSLSVENGSKGSDLIDATIKIGSIDTIDGTYCNTLKEAIVAVSEDTKEDNNTITLLESADLDDCIEIKKNIKIDLNSKTLKVSGNAEFDITSSLTMLGGRMETEESNSVNGNLFCLTEAGNLTFDGVTLNVTLDDEDYYGVKLINIYVSADSDGNGLCPSLTIKNSELTVKSDSSFSCYLVNIEGTDALENSKNVASVSINNSTLNAGPKKKDRESGHTIQICAPTNSTIVASTIKGGCDNVVSLSAGIHTIMNTTIESTKTGTKNGSATALKISGNGYGVKEKNNQTYINANVTVTNVKLGVSKGESVALDVSGDSDGTSPAIAGTITAYMPDDPNKKDESGKYLKLNDDALINLKYNDIIARVSKDGTTQGYYTSLYDAVLAAKDNETVILLCDASGSGLERKDSAESGHETRETITIDFNNHTYTMDSNSVGSSGTQTQAMHWGKSLESLTLKNGTFAVSKSAGDSNGNNVRKNFNMAMQCYIPLTAKDMTFDLANVPNEQYDSTYNEPYKGTEKPHFNCYDTTTFTNCTITLNTENDYGLLAGESTGGSPVGNITLDNTKLTGNAAFETVGKGSITLKNGSTISGGVISQFTDNKNEIKRETKNDVTTYTYVVKATD